MMKLILAVLTSLLPGPLKRVVYRLRGARIGHGVRIGPLAVLAVADLELADGASIGAATVIRARSLHMGARARIGVLCNIGVGRLHMDQDSTINKQTTVTGGPSRNSELVLGKRSRVFDQCVIDAKRQVRLDDDAGLGGGSFVFTHASWQSVLDGCPADFGPVHIKHNVWLPWRSFIMPNVTIGEFTVVSAGSVVQRSLPAYALAAGMPARVILADGKHLNQPTREQKIAMVHGWLREAAAELEYEGRRVVMSQDADRFVLSIDAETCVFQPSFDSVPDAHVMIALDRIPDAVLTSLQHGRVAWIDLTRKRCALAGPQLFDAVRRYLSFYGGLHLEPTSAIDALQWPDLASPAL
jgi:acetyltransferase-like isoleucine patch superfamily enzyme